MATISPCLAPEQDDQAGQRIRLSRRDEPLVLFEVVEARGALRNRQQFDRAGDPLDQAPLHGRPQEDAQHRQDVVGGLRRPVAAPSRIARPQS
jgi:hypothetical protein